MSDYIKCPLRYTGNKYKLLSQILPLFPKNINTFVDLFAGSYTVGINVNANNYVCNDMITYLIEFFDFLKNNDLNKILETIDNIIGTYQLSKTNLEGYNVLREVYNQTKYPLILFILTCFSFNHQIRFNNNHQFNSSFGKYKSCYNDSIKNDLIKFTKILKNQNIQFFNGDYKDCLNKLELNENDFVYLDPPYLISTAAYNDGNRGFKMWTENDEKELLNYLDELNNKNVKWALSNVLENNGSKNDILFDWSQKYIVHHLNYTYNNCNYHRKNKGSNDSDEVLITNY